MKRAFVALFFVCLVLSSCSDRRSSARAGIESDTAEVAVADSLQTGITDAVMPEGADELFDDFFFNYAASLTQQQERTVFPLPLVKEGATTRITKKQWHMERFFMKEDSYTLIFDSPHQLDLLTDTMVSDVVVERFMDEKNMAEQFFFSRKSGRWMLHEIRYQSLMQNANAQFLKFYHQFASDSLFQHHSLAEQINFSGQDPDDDFSTIDGVITPEFWDGFKPDLPNRILYNIVYGHQDPTSMQKILLLRGIANGWEVELTFKLQKGHWKLTRLST